MKPKLPPKPRPLPKARVMYASYPRCSIVPSIYRDKESVNDITVLVIPFSSLKSAKAAKRFWKLSEEEQVEVCVSAMMSWSRTHPGNPSYGDYARAILSLIGGDK